MEHPRFASGDVSTSFVETELDLSTLTQPAPAPAGGRVIVEPQADAEQTLTIEIEGKRFEVAVRGLRSGGRVDEGAARASLARPAAPVSEARAGSAGEHVRETVRAPMQGTVVKTAVAAGDSEKAGQLLIVLEAMKMENHISSPRDGTVSELPVQPGQNVETGAALVVIE
jgi:biotin carboxyl carrier protein